MISREGGKNEHPADRKLKVYRCFSISIAAAFQGRAVISIDQLFRRCFEKVAATHHTPPSFLSLPPSSNSNRSRTRILELYADYIARVTIGTLSRYENKTRRDPVAASSLPPSRFFPRQQFDERRFFLGDRGEIWRKMGARKRGITICKRTRRSR